MERRDSNRPGCLACLALMFAATSALLCSLASVHAQVKVTRNTRSGAPAAVAKTPAAVRSANLPPTLPRYVSIDTIRKLQKLRAASGEQRNARSHFPLPSLRPFLDGQPLPAGPAGEPNGAPQTILTDRSPIDNAGIRLAQAPRRPAASPAPRFPRPLTPAVIRPATNPTPTIPRWVRYPLEFQLGGIGLGMRAVDKDQYNRIDRYGLFALHGNPTAVVVPTVAGQGVTVQQQPPEVRDYFLASEGPGLPNWAAAVTMELDANHVEWLYRRENYSMGFVVDRLGFIDAIVVAGNYSPISSTQLEDPLHTVQLGDDLRKVMFRYGYPDTVESYVVNVAGQANAIGQVGQAAAAAGAAGGAEGGSSSESGGSSSTPSGSGSAPSGGSSSSGSSGGGEGGAAGGGAGGNVVYRTFELRYEQSYNVVFTIRDNRVVRIYIFGDPDFFNAARRNQLRTEY